MKRIAIIAICIAGVTLTAMAQDASRRRGRSRLDLRTVRHDAQVQFDEEDLSKRWRSAKSGSEKTKIAKSLGEQLDKRFDKDMARRKRHIAEIEERLEQLKALYAKRKKAKSDIVKLQTQAITMDWEGLGFARNTGRADGIQSHSKFGNQAALFPNNGRRDDTGDLDAIFDDFCEEETPPTEPDLDDELFDGGGFNEPSIIDEPAPLPDSNDE